MNTALTQMDKVTQQNAANAEESASASEQLSAQAETMKESIGDLTALVSGRRASDNAARAPQSKSGRGNDGSRTVRPPRKQLPAKSKPQAKPPAVQSPLDGEFTDF